MKQTLSLLLYIFAITFMSSNSFAALDDGFALKRKQIDSSTKQVAKQRINKSVRSKNDKKMIAHTLKENKKVVFSSIQSKGKALGSVPSHIQENWHSLSNDQKEIIYSYHNENPYAQINKKHFEDLEKPNKEYEHDTAYGFDTEQQVNLDDLRQSINGATTDELPEDTKNIVETLAAIEADL